MVLLVARQQLVLLLQVEVVVQVVLLAVMVAQHLAQQSQSVVHMVVAVVE